MRFMSAEHTTKLFDDLENHEAVNFFESEGQVFNVFVDF